MSNVVRERVVAAGVLALATLNFLVGLGSSSLYVDEGLSWSAASLPLGDVVDRVRGGEISPPLHYLGLHEVIGRVSDSEVAMRLPSALAGIGLVAATMWIGIRIAGGRAGLLAGVLAALSPLLLEYSQHARAYAPAMLAAALATGALLEAERSPRGSRGRRWWLLATVTASIVGVWTHYTAALVIVPLFASAFLRRTVTLREGVGLTAVTAGGWLPLGPFLADQLSHGHEEGVAPLARLNVENFIEAAGTPFDSRYAAYDLTVFAAVGALTVAAAAVVAIGRAAADRPLVRSLALPLAFFPVGAALIVTVLGPDVLVTRYTAVAGPFMLVLVAAVVFRLPQAAAVAVAGAAVLTGLAGSVAGHTGASEYIDWRAGTRELARHARAGDRVLITYQPSFPLFQYYAKEVRLPPLQAVPLSDPRSRELFRGGRRVWVLSAPAWTRMAVIAGLAAVDYQPRAIKRFDASEPLGLALAVPR